MKTRFKTPKIETTPLKSESDDEESDWEDVDDSNIQPSHDLVDAQIIENIKNQTSIIKEEESTIQSSSNDVLEINLNSQALTDLSKGLMNAENKKLLIKKLKEKVAQQRKLYVLEKIHQVHLLAILAHIQYLNTNILMNSNLQNLIINILSNVALKSENNSEPSKNDMDTPPKKRRKTQQADLNGCEKLKASLKNEKNSTKTLNGNELHGFWFMRKVGNSCTYDIPAIIKWIKDTFSSTGADDWTCNKNEIQNFRSIISLFTITLYGKCNPDQLFLKLYNSSNIDNLNCHQQSSKLRKVKTVKDTRNFKKLSLNNSTNDKSFNIKNDPDWNHKNVKNSKTFFAKNNENFSGKKPQNTLNLTAVNNKTPPFLTFNASGYINVLAGIVLRCFGIPTRLICNIQPTPLKIQQSFYSENKMDNKAVLPISAPNIHYWIEVLINDKNGEKNNQQQNSNLKKRKRKKSEIELNSKNEHASSYWKTLNLVPAKSTPVKEQPKTSTKKLNTRNQNANNLNGQDDIKTAKNDMLNNLENFDMSDMLDSDFNLETNNNIINDKKRNSISRTSKYFVDKTLNKNSLNNSIANKIEMGNIMENIITNLPENSNSGSPENAIASLYIHKPLAYVVGIDDRGILIDLTQKYSSDWHFNGRKLRISQRSDEGPWWDATLMKLNKTKTLLNLQQDQYNKNSKYTNKNDKKFSKIKVKNCVMKPKQELLKIKKNVQQEILDTLEKRPVPNTINAFKDHPLYVLKRHLLRNQAIYPPDAKPVGFVKGEPIYLRKDHLHALKPRLNWLKEDARLIKTGEIGYKLVLKRPSFKELMLRRRLKLKGLQRYNTDNIGDDIECKASLLTNNNPSETNNSNALNVVNENRSKEELFGLWQTEPYIPPPVVDGKIPVNTYGNVELFKMSMLPLGCVYLSGLPGLNRVAQRLGPNGGGGGLQCVPAMKGWEFSGGHAFPIIDGWVILEQDQERLLDEYDRYQIAAENAEKEKISKKALMHWKKFIKSVLIRQKVQMKYG